MNDLFKQSMPLRTMPCSSILYHIIAYNVQCQTIASHRIVQVPQRTVPYRSTQCHIAPYNTILCLPCHTTAFHSTIYNSIPYRIVPQPTVPYLITPRHSTPRHTTPHHSDNVIPKHTILKSIKGRNIAYSAIHWHTVPQQSTFIIFKFVGIKKARLLLAC